MLSVNHRGDIITGGVEQWLIRLAQSARAKSIERYAALPERGTLAAMRSRCPHIRHVRSTFGGLALRYLTDRRFAEIPAEAGRERIAREFCQAKYVTDLAEYYASIKTAFSPEDQARRQTLADGALAPAQRHADLSLRLEPLERHLRPDGSWRGRHGIKNFARRVRAWLFQSFRGQGL